MKLKQVAVVLAVVVLGAAAIFAGVRAWRLDRTLLGLNWPELDGGVYAQAVTSGQLQYLVPPDEVYASGLDAESRPSLNEPKYDSVTDADAYLANELEGIAVEVDGDARFYPFQILNWHPVVNDVVNEQPLAITYSVLSGSAVVYEADLNSTVYSFYDSGKVYNNTLLMANDRDNRLWDQTTGQAVVGDAVGDELVVYPAEVTAWQDWKAAHPNGLVLSKDTGFDREYGRHPFASYETSAGIFFPLNHVFPALSAKTLIYRLDYQDQTLAYTARYLPFQTEPNDDLGAGEDVLPVTAFYDGENDQLHVFDRRVDGQTLTFERVKDTQSWRDKETGSIWNFAGIAVSGRHRGQQLKQLTVTRHYAFAYFAMYPKSLISGADLIPAENPDAETNYTDIGELPSVE
jgi:hypothetical protein